MSGTVGGIAVKARSRAPMLLRDAARVTVDGGIDGDYRGVVRPGGRARRQVSLIERADWDAVMVELGRSVPWQERRANLLVDGFDLPQRGGVLLRIGTALLETVQECDPCIRMEAVCPGLQAALTSDWRGGVLARVIEAGEIAVGDAIGIEER